MWINGRVLRRNPRLTICAEAHDRGETALVLVLDVLMLLIYLEREHCRKQFETYK